MERPKYGTVIFPTFPLTNGLAEAIRHALNAGFRAFDSAQLYGNEAEFGAAVRSLGLARAEFVVTTKSDPANYGPKSFLPSLQRSLDLLHVDYVDLLLLHYPPPARRLPVVLGLLADAQEAGLARSIGVANFSAAEMRKARDIHPATAMINQVDLQPLAEAGMLLDAATATAIRLQAYPLVSRLPVMTKALLARLGRPHGKTPEEVAEHWILQRGIDLVTHSFSHARVATGSAKDRSELSSTDMERIDALTGFGRHLSRDNVISLPVSISDKSGRC